MAAAVQGEGINNLPLSPEFHRQEIVLDQIPQDAVVMPDQSIWLLTGPQLRLEHWHWNAGSWQRASQVELLAATPDRRQPLQYLAERQHILVACQQGIMAVDLTGAKRPQWLRPGFNQRLHTWSLVDLDDDGEQDILMQGRRAAEVPVWSWQDASGALRPPADLSQEPIGRHILARGPQPWLVAIDPDQDHLVRSYRLAHGEQSALGQSHMLALPEGAGWTVAHTADGMGLFIIERDQPRCWWHLADIHGWQTGQSFPVPSGIESVVAVQQGLVWLKTKDGLLASTWTGQRWSYPEPAKDVMPEIGDDQELSLVGMGQVPGQPAWAWLVWKVGEDLHVLTRSSDGTGKQMMYPGRAGKAENAQWLGADRLLVQDRFSPALRLLKDGSEDTLSADRKRTLDQFRLLGSDQPPVRLVDGVVEILDDALQPRDQLMLDDGERIADILWWGDAYHALSSNGDRLHILKPDGAGIFRMAGDEQIPAGSQIDVVTRQSLVVSDQGRVVLLQRGSSHELQVQNVIDARKGRNIDDEGVHRIGAVDIDQDGTDELLLFDDIRHEIHLYQRADTSWSRRLSWQVFTDEAYPYGYRADEALRGEPRAWAVLDMDGDGSGELMLLCHDRLIAYISSDLDSADDKAAGGRQ